MMICLHGCKHSYRWQSEPAIIYTNEHDAESNSGTNMGTDYTKYMISNVHRFTVYYYM